MKSLWYIERMHEIAQEWGLREERLSAERAMSWRRASLDGRPAAELLTIVTASSLLPSHPSTAILQRAIRSLVSQAGLAGCRHLIVCDGHASQYADDASRYEEYKRRLRVLAAYGQFRTQAEILGLDQAIGLAGVILAAMKRVHTPLIFVYEHDWEIIRPINTSGILRVLTEDRGVHHVRLNKRRNREAGWDFVIKPDVRRRAVSLVRTSTWSANPHFAKLSYYRRMILPHVHERPGGGALGFEDPICKQLYSDIRVLGFDRAQRRWGNFIYGPIGAPAVVRHLDGREKLGSRHEVASAVGPTSPR